MTTTADKVRELAARGEGTALDFKQADYDWSNRAGANAELAKDLMALANMLRPNSEPAYILIGVKDDGSIVGVPSTGHLDDAALHQKVRGLLSQTPTFSYGVVDVDGLSVGVYEITGGTRPYFPLRDAAPSLRRHVALYRNGSSADEASPTMILAWAREDDPDAHRLRSLELLKLEAEARVHARLISTGVSANGDGVLVTLEIQNFGRSGFSIDTCEWTVEWNDRFREELVKYKCVLPEGYRPPTGRLAIDRAGFIGPGAKIEFRFKWTRAEALTHVAEWKIGVAGFSANWAAYKFVVPYRGELGTNGDLRWTANP